jgi:hypothetical protein
MTNAFTRSSVSAYRLCGRFPEICLSPKGLYAGYILPVILLWFARLSGPGATFHA